MLVRLADSHNSRFTINARRLRRIYLNRKHPFKLFWCVFYCCKSTPRNKGIEGQIDDKVR